jgi:hypothetical protein
MMVLAKSWRRNTALVIAFAGHDGCDARFEREAHLLQKSQSPTSQAR